MIINKTFLCFCLWDSSHLRWLLPMLWKTNNTSIQECNYTDGYHVFFPQFCFFVCLFVFYCEQFKRGAQEKKLDRAMRFQSQFGQWTHIATTRFECDQVQWYLHWELFYLLMERGTNTWSLHSRTIQQNPDWAMLTRTGPWQHHRTYLVRIVA